jgi:hypothetical protein
MDAESIQLQPIDASLAYTKESIEEWAVGDFSGIDFTTQRSQLEINELNMTQNSSEVTESNLQCYGMVCPPLHILTFTYLHSPRRSIALLVD